MLKLEVCLSQLFHFLLIILIHFRLIFISDPTGEGNGGESIWGLIEGREKRFFQAEYLPKIRHSEPGLLSMVSLGDNLIGSQFFFSLGSDQTSLDGIHCVIGQVVEGLDVLLTINETICDNTSRPYKDIRITHTVILDDPFENPRGFREPSRSPSPTAERLRGGKIAADEEIDDASGKTEFELAEMRKEREAKARATILEIIGDLPDAEVAPPENVLFVCKLNSITTDDDLEIIFSRFGKIKGCEVIRDRKSGDSLQYAFIEFEDQKACEQAYFKMDNVLIDDRRIHVDFSQSVSKIQWKGKGRGIIVKDGSKNNRLDFDNYNKPIHRNDRSNRDDANRRYGGDSRNERRSDFKRSNNRRSRSRSPLYRNKNNDRRSRSKSPYRQRNVDRKREASPYRRNQRDSTDEYRNRRRSRSTSRNKSERNESKRSSDKNQYKKHDDERRYHKHRSPSNERRKSDHKRERTPKKCKKSKHKKDKKSRD